MKCPTCKGFGLTPKRDRFGFGIPCPTCKGTGVKPPKKPPTAASSSLGETPGGGE